MRYASIIVAILLSVVSLRAQSNMGGGGAAAATTSYLGLIATREGFIPKANGGANTYSMSNVWHVARIASGVSLTTVQIVIGNFWDPNTGETNNGAQDDSVACSIEFPIGTFNQCKFSGATTTTVAAGAIRITDGIVLAAPLVNGSLFKTRYYYHNASGIHYFSNFDPNNDLQNFGASGVTDQTMGGTVSQAAPGTGSDVLAIIGPQTLPSVCIIGDSRASGLKDGAGNYSGGIVTNPYIGEIAPSIAPVFPFINLAVSGEQAATFISGSHVQKVTLSQYCSHIVDELGTNDIYAASASAATLIGYQQTIAGYFPSKPFFLTTISPESSSSDNFTTLGNQSVSAMNAAYQAYNEQVRSSKQLSFVTDIFDIAAVTEAGMGSGLWIVAPSGAIANYATADGTHENEVGNRLIKISGAVNPNKIRF